MTLESIYYIGQTIAVVAIFASLGILILQNRQSQKQMEEANRLARGAAQQAQVESLQSVQKALFETPGLAGIWGRGSMDLASLDKEELIRFVSYLEYVLRIWEALFLRYRRGELDEQLWTAHLRQAASAMNRPGVYAAWELRKPSFSDAYCEFVEQMIHSPGAAVD
jgi:hypothetical protein